MKQLTLNNKNYLFVEVPEDASDFWINNAGCLRYSKLNGKISSVVSPEQMGVYLEKDKHLILGKASDVSEEFLKDLFNEIKKTEYGSHGPDLIEITRKEQLTSLIRSIGMETEKTVILTEKK